MVKNIIKCVCCHTEFTAMPGFEESRQAMGCASYVEGNNIIGAYGSMVFDMEEGRVSGDLKDVLPDGEICDSCIERLIKADQLMRHEDGQALESNSKGGRAGASSVLRAYALAAVIFALILIPAAIFIDVKTVFAGISGLYENSE